MSPEIFSGVNSPQAMQDCSHPDEVDVIVSAQSKTTDNKQQPWKEKWRKNCTLHYQIMNTKFQQNPKAAMTPIQMHVFFSQRKSVRVVCCMCLCVCLCVVCAYTCVHVSVCVCPNTLQSSKLCSSNCNCVELYEVRNVSCNQIPVIIEIYRALSETQSALQLKEKRATHNIFTLKSVA